MQRARKPPALAHERAAITKQLSNFTQCGVMLGSEAGAWNVHPYREHAVFCSALPWMGMLWSHMLGQDAHTQYRDSRSRGCTINTDAYNSGV